MTVQALLTESGWDAPVFKRLASNDTGAATGHQGGVVIPKDLRRYFPSLVASTSAVAPTTDAWIRADLFRGSIYVRTVSTRYQYQTWGGARSPESRLTGNLGPIRDRAEDGDVLIIQRALESLQHYRLILVRQGEADWKGIEPLLKGRRWGVLGEDLPISQTDIERAWAEEEKREEEPLKLFEEKSRIVETRAKRVARSVAFRERVREQYESRCCVCKTGLRSPEDAFEIEAAHIVPRQLNGADDARNGLSLCRRHHWAFDRGLWAVDDDRKVLVPRQVARIAENKPLREFEGARIIDAKRKALAASIDALRWHREKIAGRYQ